MQMFLRQSMPAIVLIGLFIPISVVEAGYNFVSLQGPGSADTEPYGFTPNGTVTGLYGDSSGNYNGFIYQNNIFTSVDVPAALNAQSTYLFYGNSAGLIAGTFLDSNGIQQAAVYNSVNQTWAYLAQPDPTSQFNEAGSISASGVVFGNWSATANGSSGYVAYAYQNGVYTSFLVPGSTLSDGGTFTYGCNSAGTLVGYYVNNAGDDVGFIRTLSGNFSYLSIPGAVDTQLFGINDDGELVGSYIGADGILHGFTDINGIIATVDAPGMDNTLLTGDDNNGDLVGISFNNAANSPFDGFIAYSVPEPSSLAMVFIGGAGLVGMTFIRRSRVSRKP